MRSNGKATSRRTSLTSDLRAIGVWTVAVVLGASMALAEGDKPKAASSTGGPDLVKQTQNPVADLISVPFQSNFNFGAGQKDKMVYVLNVQPVIPISLNEDWNLITRTIIPIINQPSLFRGVDSEFGLGDINPSLFLSPAKPSKFVWGVGPTMTFPTASSSLLGSGRWSAGPTAVGLLMDGPWVVGALVNHQWDYAGWTDRNVNMLLIQPFINYNLPHGWYLNTAPIVTGDFASSGSHWTVPIGGGGGKLWRVGKVGLPVNTQLQAYYNAETPKFGPDWQLRFQLQFLFPR